MDTAAALVSDGGFPFVELGVAAFVYAGPGDVCFAPAPLAGLADVFGTGAGFFRLEARGKGGDLAAPFFFCDRGSSVRPVAFPTDPAFSLFSEAALPLNVYPFSTLGSVRCLSSAFVFASASALAFAYRSLSSSCTLTVWSARPLAAALPAAMRASLPSRSLSYFSWSLFLLASAISAFTFS